MSGLPDYWTTDAARGWGGDRFYLLERGGDPERAAGVWFTLWDTAADRDEFARRYRETPAGGEARSIPMGERGEVLAFGLTGDEAAALERTLAERPPRFWRKETGQLVPWTPAGP
jgi:hypothetical protein